MKRISFLLCALCATSFVPAASGAAALSEQLLRDLARDVEEAAEARDVTAILEHMSRSVTVEFRTPGKPERTFDYAAYRYRLQRFFPVVSYYAYERSEMSMSIRPDRQSARVRFHVEERYVVQGKYNKEQHWQEWLVRMGADGPRIERVRVE